jgi:chromosome segregation ATPase
LIEQAMYFALGFLVAGLFTLMFLPAFWRRAMRLSMRRLQMLAPMSMEQVVAERDLLRAEASANYRQLEQRMESVKASKAQDLLEIGRQAVRVADLDKRLTETLAQKAGLEQSLAETQKIVQERTDLLSSTEAALLEMTERAERGVQRLRNLRSRNEEFGRQTEVEKTRMAAHETKIAALHAQNTDLERELDQLREKFAKVSAEAARLAEVDVRLKDVTTALDSAQEQKLALERKVSSANDRLDALEKRRREEVERLEAELKSERLEEKEKAERLEIARSDNAMLQGAVEALRREHATMRLNSHDGPMAASRDGIALSEGDVSALRHAISDMGAKMARISSNAEREAREPTDA